ncbi:helix-turn-helix transcriptional regulator [Asanoa sp. WMMD1127]|uniref:helix-turn-helix domain-containing protein n=1 Tax=Asanoa sp. WMMD1127 TaxID=3016107 RepID=UPI0024179179|nr:helix-turn-helix transcriptional regulator [Asanoa sp. WMMD1127]MDG4822349.1 helix-turn-helix transcriptional regulator [Asanoa sp. WMMD1127]
MTDTSPLAALGLRPIEEATYRELVARPAATTEELAAALDATVPATGAALTSLHGLGLAARSGGRYIASSPTFALGPLVTQRRDQLRRAELELANLAARYRATAADRAAGDLVEVVTGVDVITRRFAQLQATATDEVQALVTATTLAVSRADNAAEIEGLGRGVRYRVVIERTVLEQEGGAADAAAALAAGEEVRVAEHVPIKLVIADRAIGVLPMADESNQPTAIVVHRSGLLDALQALFDAVWHRALPLTLGPDGALEEQSTDGALFPLDRQVLALLLAGLTDRAIASQLGMSMRTVQRRVQRMMELAGVRTRMQLGWYAAQTEWA